MLPTKRAIRIGYSRGYSVGGWPFFGTQHAGSPSTPAEPVRANPFRESQSSPREELPAAWRSVLEDAPGKLEQGLRVWPSSALDGRGLWQAEEVPKLTFPRESQKKI